MKLPGPNLFSGGHILAAISTILFLSQRARATIGVIVFALVPKYKNIRTFYIFTLVFSFTMLVTALICPTLLGKLYGFTPLGLLTGFVSTLHHIGNGLWAYLGGIIFDGTGSYQLAFTISAASAALAVICAAFIQEKRHAKSSPSHEVVGNHN